MPTMALPSMLYRVFLCFCLVIIGERPSASAVVAGTTINAESCPCGDPSNCNFVEVGERQEVLGWSTHPGRWMHYDWSKITTIAVFRDRSNTWDEDVWNMTCFAHSKQVRVVLMGFYDVANLSYPDRMSAWIQEMLVSAEKNRADGINIDIEQPILKGSKANEQLVWLVKQTRDAFHQRFPHSQVTFDVAWSTDCVDNRCYDAKGLADASDFLVLMSYDEQGQIYPPQPCVAGANAGLQQTLDGITTYLSLGISSRKLVLGQPWYGYDYTCVPHIHNPRIQLMDEGLHAERKPPAVCPMRKVPYQGAPCSDAAGTQIEYRQVMRLLHENSTDGSHWNAAAKAPYFDYYDHVGHRHQVWYDNPTSLALKYELVQKLGMRGIAFWGTDFLDYTGKVQGRAEAKVMWDVVNVQL